MNQEVLMKAAMFQKQSEEIESQLELIVRQIAELGEFSQGLKEFSASNQKDMLSSLGKGVFVKTSLKEKDLFVDVGSGVIVKKTPEQTIKIIEEQLKKLNEAKIQLTSQLESFHLELRKIIEQIEMEREKSK